MKNDMIERYVYAVTRRLPKKMREDVAREIEGLIGDMLEERCREVVPTEKDIRVVLTELGTPGELYEQYAGTGGKCLIGQPYYTPYIYVMKIVLACVVLGMTVSAIILAVTNELQIWEALANWISTLIAGESMESAY